MTMHGRRRFTMFASGALTLVAGCVPQARLAEAERRIDTLEWHVASIELLLDEAVFADDEHDVTAMQLVERAHRGGGRARLAAARQRLAARRDAHRLNLAHADTPAFKRRVVHADADGGPRVDVRFEAGSLDNTNRQLDVAIHGNGFFCLRLADGRAAYTRGGNLSVDPQGRLVLGNVEGATLEPTLELPRDTVEINIAEDGSVQAIRKGIAEPVNVGRFAVARFVDVAALAPVDAAPSVYLATETSGAGVIGRPGEAGCGTLLQGFLEASNVSPEVEDRGLTWTLGLLARVEAALAE